MRLEGTSALVVGGTAGLGAAAARRLVAEGCDVVITGRDVEKGQNASVATGAHFQPADVLHSDELIATLEFTASLAPFRVLVHCAGSGAARRTIGRDSTYASAHSLEEFSDAVNTNLVGAFNVMRLGATAMSRSKPDETGQRGSIVVVSSLAARAGQVGQTAYAAAKAGQLGMLRPMARDLAGVGIRINAVAPGGMETEIYGEDGPSAEFRRKVGEAAIYPRRMGTPEEFASLALELLRNDYLNATTVELAAGTADLPR